MGLSDGTRKSEIATVLTVLVDAAKQLISSNSPENKLQVKLSNGYCDWFVLKLDVACSFFL